MNCWLAHNQLSRNVLLFPVIWLVNFVLVIPVTVVALYNQKYKNAI